MSKKIQATCEECYFRRAGLCALQVEVACPTFRAFSKGTMVAPPQPRLVPRTLDGFVPQPAAA
jgi:hypothetical protein